MKTVISGCGVISAVGNNCQETIANFETNLPIPHKVTVFETPLTCPVFEVKNLECTEKQRTVSLLQHALDEALDSAKLSDFNNMRVGVCLGTTVACQLNDLEFYRSFRGKTIESLKPVNRYLNSSLAEYVKQKYSLTGPTITVANACSSGTDAIGTAASWIRNGLSDIAIAGGADEINLIPLAGFTSLGVVSETPCTPFDKNRSGLNLGEGAGIVILESDKHASKRRISSELSIASYASAADAYHLTAPSPEGTGLKKALTTAMATAGITAADISFINAHGTSTKDNDLTEGKVFAELFKEDLKFISTKGATGHTLGAAGGIETVFTSLALINGWLPASPGFKTKDDDIPVQPLSAKTEIRGNYAVSTSLAFGGNNSALVIRREN